MRNAQLDGANKSLMNPPCFLMLQFMSASHRFSLAARGNLTYQGMYPLCWSKPIDLSLYTVSSCGVAVYQPVLTSSAIV
jgi:hypothetical protein